MRLRGAGPTRSLDKVRGCPVVPDAQCQIPDEPSAAGMPVLFSRLNRHSSGRRGRIHASKKGNRVQLAYGALIVCAVSVEG
jgi:hypothetical protein